MKMELGMEVEVGSNEPGLKGSWYEAKILRRMPKKDQVSVEYRHLVSDEGVSRPLWELVLTRFVRPRPPPPASASAEEAEFRLGAMVEVSHLDGWWVGVLISVPGPASASAKYLVYFPEADERIEFTRSQLRLHREWDGRRWLPPSSAHQIYCADNWNIARHAAAKSLKKRSNQGDVKFLVPKKKLKKVPATKRAGRNTNSVGSIGDETPNEVLKSTISNDEEVEQAGNNAKLADVIVQSATVSRAGAEEEASDSSKEVTIQDRLNSLVLQKNSKKAATKTNSNPIAPPKMASDETLTEIWKRSLLGQLPAAPGRKRIKKLALKRKDQAELLRARNEGNVEVSKVGVVESSNVHLNDGDNQQLNRKLNASDLTDPGSPCSALVKKLQYHELPKASGSVLIPRLYGTPSAATMTSRCPVHNKCSGDRFAQIEVVKASSKSPSSALLENMQTQQMLNMGDIVPISIREGTTISTIQTDGDDFICRGQNRSSEGQSAQIEMAKANTISPACEEQTLRSPDLPFIKRSPMWKVVQSNDVFEVMPQSPHFQPLKACSEILREGLAIGHMIGFANLVDATSKIQILDGKSVYDKMLLAITDFEGQGFNCQPLRTRLEELTQLKDSFVLSESKLFVLEGQINERRCRERDLNSKIKSIDDEIAMQLEKRKSLKRMKEMISVEPMQKQAETLKDNNLNIKRDFHRVAAAPWKALAPAS